MKTTNRPELSFDGFGINGPDEYRTRLCKFNHMDYSEADCQRYGKLFAAAPELLEALKLAESALSAFLPQHPAGAIAREAIVKAEGKAVQS